ncbi:MAG: aconitase X [Gemmatimonadales bacterium]
MTALAPAERALLAGEGGAAARTAMRIVVRMAEISGAAGLLDISAAHIDSSLYLGDATLAFAERLAAEGGRVAVPSTLNVSGVDEHGWRDWAVPADHAAKARRQMDAYRQMGCVPTWTCAPYQTRHRPTFGQQLAWGESNAICFANSVIGARTERYPDLLDICCALTGRVPALGLHLDEGRRAEVLIRLRGVPRAIQEADDFYPVLGHLIGRRAADRIPVVEGLEATPDDDRLKALCAAAASAGAVALVHLVGVTPEAPTLAAATGGRSPAQSIDIGLAELRAARAELTTATGDALDLVVLGSPHFSLAEFRALAPLCAGRRRAAGVEFLVTTSRIMHALARDEGLVAPLEDFGARITVDTCILTSPMLRPETRSLMTNSAKYAYYSPGLLGTTVAFGRLAECVESAVRGKVVREADPWRA